MVRILLLCLLPLLASAQQSKFVYGSQLNLASSGAVYAGDATFATISGLYIQLMANAPTNWVTTNGGAYEWLDLSGQVHDFTNNTAAQPKPVYTNTGPNGFYAVMFTNNGTAGSAEFLYCIPDLQSNPPNTYVIVCTDTADGGTDVLFDSKDVGVVNTLTLSTASAQISGGGSAVGSVNIPNSANSGNWSIQACVINGDDTSYQLNAGAICSARITGGAGMGQMMIGNSSGLSKPYKGSIAAVLVWRRALRTNELSYVYQQLSLKYNFGLTITSNAFDVGTIWADRVSTNSGAYPSSSSKVAIMNLAEGMVTDDTWKLMGSLVLYPTDNLVAARTPIIQIVAGNDPWVNHNFVAGDLTANGLTGNTTTKYLDSGIVASTALTANNTALFSYIIHVNTASGVDIAASNSGNTQDILLIGDDAGTAFWDAYNATAGAGRISVATKGAGYYSGSRTSSSSTTLYFANQGNAHASIASAATAGGSLPAFSIFSFAENNNGSPAVWSDNQIRANGICAGVTSAQDSKIFNQLVTYQTAVGGSNP